MIGLEMECLIIERGNQSSPDVTARDDLLEALWFEAKSIAPRSMKGNASSR
jgi:hypothetical protein